MIGQVSRRGFRHQPITTTISAGIGISSQTRAASSFFAALSDPIGGDRRSDANAKRLIGWNPCSDESDVSGIGGRNEIHDFCQGESEH
jgi:hypothetical protein